MSSCPARWAGVMVAAIRWPQLATVVALLVVGGGLVCGRGAVVRIAGVVAPGRAVEEGVVVGGAPVALAEAVDRAGGVAEHDALTPSASSERPTTAAVTLGRPRRVATPRVHIVRTYALTIVPAGPPTASG
ncbi:MAG: hypothetical protein ACXVGT_18315, partial [Oryzihumus sp.]